MACAGGCLPAVANSVSRMLRLAADENFNRDIVRAIRRHEPRADVICLQDVGLSGSPDEEVLRWCAEQNRVLLTHDVTTITRHAFQRIREGKPMPGVFQVGAGRPAAEVIEDILLIIECSADGEWEGQVRYLPL